MDTFLAKILASNADIEYIVILDGSSRVLSGARAFPPRSWSASGRGCPAPGVEAGAMTEIEGFTDSAYPIAAGGAGRRRAARGVSREYVRGRLSEIIYEAMTVIVVSLLVTLEFLVFFMNVRISGPLERLETLLADGARGAYSPTSRAAHARRDRRSRRRLQPRPAGPVPALRGLPFRCAREIEDAQIDRSIAQRNPGGMHAGRRAATAFTGGEELRPTQRHADPHPAVPVHVRGGAATLVPAPVRGQAQPGGHGSVSNELLIGLPITLFMLAAAVMITVRRQDRRPLRGHGGCS